MKIGIFPSMVIGGTLALVTAAGITGYVKGNQPPSPEKVTAQKAKNEARREAIKFATEACKTEWRTNGTQDTMNASLYSCPATVADYLVTCRERSNPTVCVLEAGEIARRFAVLGSK